MRLVFNNTGDTIELEPNKRVFEYYTKQLDDSSRNHFNVVGNSALPTALTQLSESLIIVNDFLKNYFKLDIFDSFVSQNLIDQKVLNELHKVWVKFQFNYNCGISKLFNDIDSELLQHFLYINSQLHIVESGFKWKFRNYLIEHEDEHAEQICENIFGIAVTDFNLWNISIVFNDQGRQTYNKWKWNDCIFTDIDTSDFTWLTGEIAVNLSKPYKNVAPLEYVEWCLANDIPVVGINVGLGNIKNWDKNLLEVRKIFLRNIENENAFSLVNN